MVFPYGQSTSLGLWETPPLISGDLSPALARQIRDLLERIDIHFSDDTPRYSLGDIVDFGNRLMNTRQASQTIETPPYDEIIHHVNSCIFKDWCRSKVPFEVWLKNFQQHAIFRNWNYIDFSECLPLMYLVNNRFLCINQEVLSHEQQNDLLNLLKESKKIVRVFIMAHIEPFDQWKLIEKLELYIPPSIKNK